MEGASLNGGGNWVRELELKIPWAHFLPGIMFWLPEINVVPWSSDIMLCLTMGPETSVSATFELNPLKPWTKLNLPSFQLFPWSISHKEFMLWQETERVQKSTVWACSMWSPWCMNWNMIFHSIFDHIKNLTANIFALLHSRTWSVHSFLIDNGIHIISSNMLMDKRTFKIPPHSYYQNFVHVTKRIVICAWECHMKEE